MPTATTNLILPKSFSLVKADVPRVIETGGKRYTETLDKEGNSHPNPVFVAGDGDTHHGALLAIEAESEERGSRDGNDQPIPDNSLPANARLSNLMSENAELRDRIEQLSADLEASQSSAAAQVDQISELEEENARLSVLPTRIELQSIQTRAETAENNVVRLEKLCGFRGIPIDCVVPPSPSPDGISSGNRYEEFASLVRKEKEGTVKPGTVSAFFKQYKKEIQAARPGPATE